MCRSTFPKPSSADGRGRWTNLGSLFRKKIKKSLTSDEIRTISKWDNLESSVETAIKPNVVEKIRNAFAINETNDAEEDSASDEENDNDTTNDNISGGQ